MKAQKMDFWSPTRLHALRYAAVALGLISMHLILAAVPEGEMDLFPDAAMVFSLFGTCGLALLFGMFWPTRESAPGPLWAGIVGCALMVFVLKQERGVTPNLAVVLGVVGLLVVPVLARRIAGVLKRLRA